jgi:rsbT co-antagonist protein RsbR
MATSRPTFLATVLQENGAAVLDAWMREQADAPTLRPDLISEAELRQQSSELLQLLGAAARSGDPVSGVGWDPVREFLSSLSVSRTAMGFTAVETATFIFSLKQPIFEQLRAVVPDGKRLVDELWIATTTIDALGLHTTSVALEARERLILRQQEDMLELSTPVVNLWDGILALPMIGTLDSARTQVVMESLLQRIVETGAEVAIIDITGVPTVDTLVAQHLIKTVTAARLMGADCIISGIRPQIAATIVHLGVDLSNVATKATLADAFRLALRRSGHSLGRTAPRKDA